MSDIEEDLNDGLIRSIKYGDIDTCNQILNKRIFTLSGYEKPLMIAAKYDQLEIYKAIQEEYKNQAENYEHNTLPSIMNSFYMADEFESKQVIDYLKQDMLMYSAKNSDTELMKFSLKNGADINLQDKDGDTVLMWASLRGNLDVVKTLIENKADVNYADSDGNIALIWASYNGHNDVVNTFIEHGADVNAKNENGWTPLIYAARNGQNEVIKTLLIDYQAKVTEEDKKELKDLGSTFTLDLIDKRDFEKSLQKDIKPIQEQTKKKSLTMKI